MDDDIPTTPVAGYRQQSREAIGDVNLNKTMEEWTLRRLDHFKACPDVHQRWLAIGRTHLEQAWMAINRAIFKPDRVKLPGEFTAPVAGQQGPAA